MDAKEILDGKEKLVEFLNEKGFEKSEEYFDEDYPGAEFLKTPNGNLMVVESTDDREKIKVIRDHFIKDKAFPYCSIYVKEEGREPKVIFFRNFGERKYFLFSKRFSSETIKGKIKKLESIGKSLDSLFQTADISKTFYERFKQKRNLLASRIEGDLEATEKYLIAQKIFDRVFFTYFICNRGIIRKSNGSEISGKAFFEILRENGEFFENLKTVFSMFNKDGESKFESGTNEIKIPYLNGGLFRMDQKEKEIRINMSKDDWKDIFKFLDTYNWIIEDSLKDEDLENDEKTLTPEILGHVYERSVVEWENIGFEKEAEEVTSGNTEKKSRGVYYTPSEITKYISENTTIPYLLEKLDDEYESFEDLLKAGNKQELEKALKTLREITILDPACGSGAFLIEAADLVYRLKRSIMYKLDVEIHPYQIKLETIIENIYGVDILKGAVEISKLRLWLWLISDFEGEQMKPLPNIDYNIRVGDSLVGWVDENLKQVTLDSPMDDKLEGIFEGLIALADEEDRKSLLKAQELLKEYGVEKYVDAYYLLYHVYRTEHNEKKASLLKNILKKIQLAVYKTINEAYSTYINEYSGIDVSAEKLEEMNIFHWRIDFSHILKKGGFDIVIGNPPYISKHAKEKISKLYEAIIFYKYKSSYIDSDFYCYFIERTNSLTKNSGHVGMITSNTFFVSVFGSPLRAILSTKEIKQIIDFKEFEVFEDASNYVQIIVYKNSTPDKNHMISCAKPLRFNPNPLDTRFSLEISELELSLRNRYKSNGGIDKKICAFEYPQKEIVNRTLMNDGKLKFIDSQSKKGKWKIDKKIPFADIWIILPKKSYKLFKYIESSSNTFLGKLSPDIFVGIQTNGDDVYILKSLEDINIKNWKYKKTIKVYPQRDGEKVFDIETGILKALVKPKMLDNYIFAWEKTFVIFPYNKEGVLLSPKILKKNYPLAWDYLSSEDTLKKMSDVSKDRKKVIDRLMREVGVASLNELEKCLKNKGDIDHLNSKFWWYRYIYPKNLVSVNKRKILTKTTSNKNSFSLDMEGDVAPLNVGVYSIPLRSDLSDFYYVLGIMNSNLSQFYLTSFLPVKRGGYFDYIKEYLSRMPISETNKKNKEKVVELVKQIIMQKENGEPINDIQDELNSLVYEIYGISECDAKIIEKYIKNS